MRRWHREQADADDLVQQTLLQALANAHRWQPGSDLRAWLFIIMRNQFITAATRSTRSASALEDIAAAPLTPPANTEELRLTLRDLYSALRRLPGNQRSAVILIGVEGKSYDEAANAMETTAGAVRSHLARGREQLRAALRDTETRLPFGPRPAGTPAGTAPRNMQLALTAAGDD